MATPTEMKTKIAKLPIDLDRMDGIVNGPASGPDSLIEVDSGQVKTLARLAQEAAVDAGTRAAIDGSNAAPYADDWKLSLGLSTKMERDGSDADADFLDNIKNQTIVVNGAGGLGASLSARFRYDTSLASFGYPVDDASDVTPALNAAMASGRDVYIPYVPGGLKMVTAPTVPTSRFCLRGDAGRSRLNKMFDGGAAFEFKGSNQSVTDIEVDFLGLSAANAGYLFDLRTDLAGMEFVECENVVSYGAAGLVRDRASASNVSVLNRMEKIYGRLHRGVGGVIQRQFAFLEWDNVVIDYAQSPTLDRAGMIVWDISGNEGGYIEKLEVSNVPRVEDVGMVGVRVRNTNALIFRQGLLDGIAGDAYLLDGGCANLKFYETRTSICSGASVKLRNGAGAGNVNIHLYGHNGVGRNNVAGGYSPAGQHGLDVQSTQELDASDCRFQQFTGSGVKSAGSTELNVSGIKCRANSRYGLEFGNSNTGLFDGGITVANGLGDYLLPGAGGGNAFLHGRNLMGNSGGLYSFDGLA